jgi:hypothetical protein
MSKQPQQTSYLGPEAVASISFLKTRELMFTWQQDDKIQSKLITPEAAFLAFKEGHQQDTGWCLRVSCERKQCAGRMGGVHSACADDRYCDRQGRKVESPHPGDSVYGLGFSILSVGTPQQEIQQKARALQSAVPEYL